MKMQSSGHAHVQNRVRKFHTKSVDGCKTCRIRRIKCDQGKPACKRCASTGRTCDGYSPSPPRKTPSSSGSSGSSCSSGSLTPCTEPCSSSSPSSIISINILDDVQERRSFEFFCQRTVPELSGAFDNGEFWQRLLLQATHHEPAVRHAAVALGALHERFENSVDANLTFKLNEKKTQDVFALQQYSKAIKALLGPQDIQGKQAADIPLMTCVLFIYFETLRGHHAAAISHINGGIKILSELHSQSSTNSTLPISTTSYVQMPTLNMLFIRFDTQASFMLSGRQPQLLSPTLDDPAAGYNAEIPQTFTSLEEARNALDHIRANEYRRMESVDRSDRAQVSLMLELVRSVALIKLWQWKKAFEEFCKRRTERGRGRATTFQNTVNILKVQKILMEITLGVSQERAIVDECIWDLYTAEFEELTKIAEAVIVGRENDKGCKVGRVLCLDVGIVLPLFYVATRCRNRKIRWKAIELMRRTERQEGLWNSVLFAKAAERCIEIEEEGLMLGGNDDWEGIVVPRERRVRGVEAIFYGQDRRARVRYRRHVGAEAREEETIEEWVDW